MQALYHEQIKPGSYGYEDALGKALKQGWFFVRYLLNAQGFGPLHSFDAATKHMSPMVNPRGNAVQRLLLETRRCLQLPPCQFTGNSWRQRHYEH